MWQFFKRNWKSCLLVGIFCFAGCSWGMLEYTHQPRFCLSCHIMQPYYDAWKSSSHNMVSCVECHYPPGLRYEVQGKLDALNQVVAYWTGQYSTKFYAEIEDASCMRKGCHTTRLVEGPIEFKRGIKFDHASHYGRPVRGIQLRCTSCHSQIVQGNHMAVTEFTCFLCHFKGRFTATSPLPQKFCLECHNYPQSYINVSGIMYNHKDYVERGVLCWRCHSDVVRGVGEVEDRACLQCHSDPEQISKIGDVKQMHLNHVTRHKVECFDCHANVIHSLPDTHQVQSLACAACHTGTHVGPRDLFAGQGGRGVPDKPSPMYIAQVDCTGCHMDEKTSVFGPVGGSSMSSSVRACSDCHGELGKKVYGFWMQSLDYQLAKTEQALAAAGRVVGGAHGSEPQSDAQKLLADAQFNYDFVKSSKGVHNFEYSLALLAKAREYAEAARKAPRTAGGR